MNNINPQNPLNQVPSIVLLTIHHKRKEYFYIALAVIIIVAGVLWWQIDRYANENELTDQLKVNNADAREITEINRDLNDISDINLDDEFKQIDADLNSL